MTIIESTILIQNVTATILAEMGSFGWGILYTVIGLLSAYCILCGLALYISFGYMLFADSWLHTRYEFVRNLLGLVTGEGIFFFSLSLFFSFLKVFVFSWIPDNIGTYNSEDEIWTPLEDTLSFIFALGFCLVHWGVFRELDTMKEVAEDYKEKGFYKSIGSFIF